MFKGDGWEPDYTEALCKQFQIEPAVLQGCQILYANYSLGCYEGAALVIYRKDGKLYEVNGSHCSCYGLEGQWEPEETTKETLLSRPSFYLCDYDGNVLEDLKKALKYV